MDKFLSPEAGRSPANERVPIPQRPECQEAMERASATLDEIGETMTVLRDQLSALRIPRSVDEYEYFLAGLSKSGKALEKLAERFAENVAYINSADFLT